MPILASFIVPHPPLIIPEIGGERIKSIEKTVKAYETVADEIASLKPETIVITSPHSVMYADCFHISLGKETKGSFKQFDAPGVKFLEEYDTDLVKKIEEISNNPECILDAKEGGYAFLKSDYYCTTLGEKDSDLDHGTMVPLFFIRQKYKEGKIVRIGLSGLPYEAHYLLGEIIAKAAEELERKIVIVASGDLSHKLKEYGPYGFAEEGVEYDKRIMDVCERAAFDEMLEFDKHFCDKAAECGHKSFIIMAGAWDGIKVRSKVYSHEDVTGVGYGICSFYPESKDDSRHFLKAYTERKNKEKKEKRDKEDEYVRLARKTVNMYITQGITPKVTDALPEDMLNKKAGVFVSIHENDNLRGCIGTILPTTDCIAEEIIHNAVSASTRDPRFAPIREDELEALEISVDVLNEPEDIDSPEELDVKKYGVIVYNKYKRGLLLPNLDGVDTIDEQISIAKSKAGIFDREEYSLQRFEVVRHY